MATMAEMTLLQQESAEAAKADETELKKRISSLSKTSAAELLSLREHWIQEQKRNRKLDEVSKRRRHEAEIWVKAIDHILSHPQAVSPSIMQGGENLTLAQAAVYLSISPSTSYHWTSQNKIPHTTVGGKKLIFARKDLDVFLEGPRRLTKEELDRKADIEIGRNRARNPKNPRR